MIQGDSGVKKSQTKNVKKVPGLTTRTASATGQLVKTYHANDDTTANRGQVDMPDKGLAQFALREKKSALSVLDED